MYPINSETEAFGISRLSSSVSDIFLATVYCSTFFRLDGPRRNPSRELENGKCIRVACPNRLNLPQHSNFRLLRHKSAIQSDLVELAQT